MRRTPRDLSRRVQWIPEKACYRFKYRDPFSGKPKLLYCVPERFREAGIPLEDPAVVRKPTKHAEALVKRLQGLFLASLGSVRLNRGMTDAPTISAAIEDYFRLYTKQSPGYRATLRRIFEEFQEIVGDKPVDQIVNHDLSAFEEHLGGRLGVVSVRSYIRQLSMLITYCWKNGWIRKDPRATYRLPKETPKDPNPFSRDELEKFFAAMEPKAFDHLRWMGVGMLCLGLRPIELEHARWEDLNVGERLLFIRKSHPNKMPQACQNQPIPLVAWPMFVERKEKEGLIWTARFGGECTMGAQSRARRTVQNRLPDFQWKRFRKSYATILQEHGNDDVIVSRLLRHSAGGKNISVAQRHYIGRNDRFLRSIVDEAFDDLRGLGPFPAAAAPARHPDAPEVRSA